MNVYSQQNKHIAVVTLVIFFIILVAWTGAWLFWLALASRFSFLENEWPELLYWLIIKTIIWILPALWILKSCDKTNEVFRVRFWGRSLTWGFCIGGILLALSIGSRIIDGNWIMPYTSPLTFAGVVIISPVYEEFLMRGAILSALKQKIPFIPANLITALLFTLLHFPGWYFKGVLQMLILNPLNGALAIFIIGFICGLAAEKGRSLLSAIIVHMLNNLF